MLETTDDQAAAERKVAGTTGMALAVALAVVLGIHPPGDADIYDDGVEFLEHVGTYWVIVHVLAALLILGLPAIVIAWARTLTRPAARMVGSMCVTTSVVSVSVAVIHLVAVDTITFEFFADTLDSGAPAAETMADGFLRLHAATLTAWLTSIGIGLPLLISAASWIDGRRGWPVYVPAATAGLGIASLVITVSERQYTTLSETILFRAGGLLIVIWLFLVGRELRSGVPVHP